jgi:hypothetical protein
VASLYGGRSAQARWAGCYPLVVQDGLRSVTAGFAADCATGWLAASRGIPVLAIRRSATVGTSAAEVIGSVGTAAAPAKDQLCRRPPVIDP